MYVTAMKPVWKKMPAAEPVLNLATGMFSLVNVKSKPAKISAGFVVLSAR